MTTPFGLRSVEKKLAPPRLIAAALVALAFCALTLIAGQAPVASAQDSPDCEVNDLGMLGSGTDEDSALSASGRWTTGDCDSRFRIDSDAHTYRFEVGEAGRIRIELASDEADSHLYLLAEDESRIADNDDGGRGLNARVERDLAPGVYLVEATTTAGRGRGAADFALSVSRVAGCETIDLGVLESGPGLTASGSWTLDTCGSRIVQSHPAYSYSFTLAQAGSVRIDLMSENGDPVLSLISAEDGVIGANDDGGAVRNSRIEQYLQAGVYLIEATTYLERDQQPLSADFDLTVRLLDEEAEQGKFLLKVEAVDTPDRVIAGEPFLVHYRVGNLGGGDLADVGGGAVIYVVAPGVFGRVFERTGWIAASEGRWGPGVSYHTGEPTASAASASIDEVAPFEIALDIPGPLWLFVGIVPFDAADEEVGFHGVWRNLTVLSGPVFGPVTVRVDDENYTVAAESDDDGVVTPVVAQETPSGDGKVADDVRAKAIFAAGFNTQVFDGLMERPAIAALDFTSGGAAPDVPPLDLGDPSSATLLKAFGQRYAAALAASGLTDLAGAGVAPLPSEIEEFTLSLARIAWREYSPVRTSWASLMREYELGDVPRFSEAFDVYAQLAYAEAVASPLVAGGRAVQAAQAAADGWDDENAQTMLAELADMGSCRAGASLAHALTMARVEDVPGAVALHAELGAASPVYAAAIDAALCAIAGADASNATMLRRLSIARTVVAEMLAPAAPVLGPQEPVGLRIVARIVEDGRVELGAELASGVLVLPDRRFLPAEAGSEWALSSDVETRSGDLGVIRARHLFDGRVELGFRDAEGNMLTPDIRFLPADAPVGVWVRSSLVTATPAGAMLSEE